MRFGPERRLFFCKGCGARRLVSPQWPRTSADIALAPPSGASADAVAQHAARFFRHHQASQECIPIQAMNQLHCDIGDAICRMASISRKFSRACPRARPDQPAC